MTAPRHKVLLKVTLLSALIVGCSGPDELPEDAVRRWVTDARAAAENRDRESLLAMLSANYTDARGNDRQSVDQMLRFFFLRHDRVVLLSKIDQIAVEAATAALVKLTVGMAGSGGAEPGFSAEAYRFELELEHDGDEWLLIAARWGALGQSAR